MDMQLAKKILWPNFFGPDEWFKFLGINTHSKSSEFPWDRIILTSPCPFNRIKRIRETHFAFYGPKNIDNRELTIMNLTKMFPLLFSPNITWYNNTNEIVSKKKTDNDWHLISISVIPNSERKIYSEQIRMIPTDYNVPQAIEEVLKNILYYTINKHFPDKGKCARCKDLSSDGRRIDVGVSKSKEYITIGRFEDDDYCDYIGISASLKP